jgi:hypothetical protein
VALQKAVEQEHYDEAVRPYTLPDGRVVNLRGPGTPVAMAGPRRADDIDVNGMRYRPTEYEPAVELPAAEVQGGVEGLPMVRPAPAPGDLVGQVFSRLPEPVREAALQNPIVGRALAANAGVRRGGARVGFGAYNLLAQGLDRLGLDGIGNAMQADAIARQNAATEYNALFREAYAGTNMAAQVLGEVAATAPVGGVVGRGVGLVGLGVGRFAPRVGQGIEAVGRSTAAGGFLPSAVRPPAAGAAPAIGERLLNLGTRAAGGAIPGGIQAALINEDDAAAGAAIGAVLPTVLARPAKWLVNATTNLLTSAARRGEGAAANIITDAMGADAERIITALRNAREGDTVRQALVRAGINNSVIQAIGDAAERVGIVGQDDYFGAFSRGQEAARRATVASAAGGDVQAASDAAARAARARATGEAGVVRERALSAANASGRLDISAIADDLMARVDRPGISADPVQTRIYSNLAARLRALADRNGGVIDAENLDVFRQIGINNEVARQLNRVTPAGATAAPQAARVAGQLGQVRAAIDDAIKEAGGAEWGQYLAQFSSAAREAERRALAGVARDTYLDSPSAFASLVEGRDRRAVEAIFGQTGDFNVAMGGNEGVSRMPALAGVAEDIRVDELAADLASQPGARDTALQLLTPPGTARANRNAIRALALATPKAGAAMAFGDAVAALRVPPRTREALNRAFRNGETFGQILERIPTPQRWQAERNLMNPAFWSGVTGVGVNAMATPSASGEQPANTMSPPPQ